MIEFKKKIILLGDYGVGKTSLVRRYVDDSFSDKYHTTIGVKISKKSVRWIDEKSQNFHVQSMIWDIQGRSGYSSIPGKYLTGASVGLVIGDLTVEDPVVPVCEHIDYLKAFSPNAVVFVAFNKLDLFKLPEADLNDYFRRVYNVHKNVSFIVATSAKTGQEVEGLFEKAAKLAVEAEDGYQHQPTVV